MIDERTRSIEIQWPDLFKPIGGVRSAPENEPLINEIVIRKEAIPIIFVPGIMGSRLKRADSGETVWDPDALGFMAFTYGLRCPPKKRKSLLIGKAAFDRDYLEVISDDSKVSAVGQGRGWGGVAQSFYGGILRALAHHRWPEPLNLCFDFPVYAFGYNWTDTNEESGRQLARTIQAIIDENAQQTACRQVILVTHSMGGLVARSACKLHNAEANVLGVVHGTQPATGAPAAYQRMKHGFRELDGSLWDWLCHPLRKTTEKIAQRVLGDEGPEVTILLANMPGGLELLPNKHYLTNDGKAQWLDYRGPDQLDGRLPRGGDPYAEIYLARSGPYRLVEPRWLGEPEKRNRSRLARKGKSGWDAYALNLKRAEKLQDSLGDYLHGETCQFFSSGIKTADLIKIDFKQYPGRNLPYLKGTEGKRYFEFRDSKNRLIDLNSEPFIDDPETFQTFARRWRTESVYAFAVEAPRGSGDGTVPDSSGNGIDARKGQLLRENGAVDINGADEGESARVHDKIFNTRTARNITLRAIENLCKARIKKEAGVS